MRRIVVLLGLVAVGSVVAGCRPLGPLSSDSYEGCAVSSDCFDARDRCVSVSNGSATRSMCTVTNCASDAECPFDMYSSRGDCLTFPGYASTCYHRCVSDADCYPGFSCYTPTGAPDALGPVCMPTNRGGGGPTVPHYRSCGSSGDCIDGLECIRYAVGGTVANVCSRSGCFSDMDCPLDARGGRGACLSFDGGSTFACWERCNVRGDCEDTFNWDCTTNVGGFTTPVNVCAPR